MACGKLNGIIVIDKPENMTSAGVVRIVKKTLKAKKVGHAGTLDPFAEGVLICCLNQATRLAGFLLHGKKKYVAVLKLGEETDTQDLTGTVVATGNSVATSEESILAVLKKFEGSLEQRPPVYSALKHAGVPLYKLARRGKPVQKAARRIQIYNIAIQDIALPFIRFEVWCSAGTYIRTLAADIGKSLGCGGHLHALKRIESSGFALDQAIPLSALDELAGSQKLAQRIIGMKEALPKMPEYCVAAGLVEKIRNGHILAAQDLGKPLVSGSAGNSDSHLKIVDQEGNLIAIVERSPIRDRFDYCCVFPKQGT